MSDTLKTFYDVLKGCTNSLRTDLQVRDVSIEHGDQVVDLTSETLLSGEYVASDAEDHLTMVDKKVVVDLFISSTTTNVILETYWTANDTTTNHLTQVGVIVEELYYTLKMIDTICGVRKGRIHVILFMLDMSKSYPARSIRNDIPFDANDVNSGYSYIKPHVHIPGTGIDINGIDIVLYRKEELLKVLKHEMLHIMWVHPLSYPKWYDDYLKTTYNVMSYQNDGSLNLFEGYVEFFALFLNTLIHSYCKMTTTTSTNVYDEFCKEFNKNMEIEQTNTLRIVKKLLIDHDARVLKSLGGGKGWRFDKEFKERTNVFSYQFVKWGLLSNWKRTIRRIRHISPNFRLDDDGKVDKYFEYVKRNLRELDVVKIQRLPLKDTRKMSMSYHTRL